MIRSYGSVNRIKEDILHLNTMWLIPICAIAFVPTIVPARRKGRQECQPKEELRMIIGLLVLLLVGLALLVFRH